MLLIALLVGMIAYVIMRLQMLSVELTWIRRYILKGMVATLRSSDCDAAEGNGAETRGDGEGCAFDVRSLVVEAQGAEASAGEDEATLPFLEVCEMALPLENVGAQTSDGASGVEVVELANEERFDDAESSSQSPDEQQSAQKDDAPLEGGYDSPPVTPPAPRRTRKARNSGKRTRAPA